jgi:glycosyltransferase involved in cell wall biosynthesis
VRPERLRLIHNGVDTSRYGAGADAAANGRPEGLTEIPEGCLVVGSVGRLHPVKGHRYLVEAWPHVRRRFPEARLLLVGPAWPDQEKTIRDAAAGAGVSDRLVLAGLRDDVHRLLPRMDVVALPSLTEGFSNVIIEAGAAGRPVVATRVGGNPEAIVEGETGLLVPPRDPVALGDAINTLLADPERRQRMGAAARRRVHALYTVERMVERWEKLYLELAAP